MVMVKDELLREKQEEDKMENVMMVEKERGECMEKDF